jgi:hypothetical protein
MAELYRLENTFAVDVNDLTPEDSKQNKLRQTEEQEDPLKGLLAQFVYSNGICKTCGKDHTFKPTFEDDVKTSIDIIPKLFHKKEHLEVSEC